MHATYTGAYHIHLYIPYTHIHTAYIHIHIHHIHIYIPQMHIHVYHAMYTDARHTYIYMPCTPRHLPTHDTSWIPPPTPALHTRTPLFPAATPAQSLGALFFLSCPGPQEICWDSAAHGQWRIDTRGLLPTAPLLPCQQRPSLVQDGTAKLSGKVAQLQEKLPSWGSTAFQIQ